MVHFEDQRFDRQNNLVISSNTSKHKVKLLINPPLVPYSLPKLVVSYHERNWTPEHDLPPSKVWTLKPGIKHKPSQSTFPTLGNRILNEEASWGKELNVDGEFVYVDGYWEWAEDTLSYSGDTLKKGMIYDAVYASLFTYDRNTNIVQAFCEAWCSLTNTLITSSGEVTISLRDLHILGGLPLFGDIYDERIPSASELTKNPDKCCAHLFEAFYRLNQKEDNNTYVQASQWINFWCKKAQKYKAPPTRTERKRPRPKTTHNPSGILEESIRWSNVSKAPFVTLGISRNLEGEVYLAAFLACWLCMFVLPGAQARTIRPETFKMACKMARGKKVCLAAPVLASIYSGLNSISESISPGQMEAPFPIHYVYGWLAAYFQTHSENPRLKSACPKMVIFSGEGGARYYNETDARKRIFKGDCISWLCTSRKNDRDFTFCDDKKAREEDFEYFLCLRPSFLILRRGPQCIAEPYMPHRFSRQFGFYQAHAPGLLNTDNRHVSLVEGLRLHRQYDNINSQSKATFPMNPTAPKKHFSEKYKAWLIDVRANFLETNISNIVDAGKGQTRERENVSRKGKAPAQEVTSPHDQPSGPATQKRREEQVRQRSSGEETASDDDRDRCWKRPKGRSSHKDSTEPHVSNDAQSSNHHSSTGEEQNSGDSNSLETEVAPQATPPSNTSHEEAQPEPSNVSILPGADSFLARYKGFITDLWKEICEKLRNIPTESISSFKGSVERQLRLMKHDGVDLSILERRVAEFFKKAKDYDQSRSQFSNAMPIETQTQELCVARSVLKKAQQKYSEAQTFRLSQQQALKESDNQRTLLEKAIEDAEKVIKDSKEKLTKIDAQQPELQGLVTKAQEREDASQEAVATAENKVKRIEESPMLTEEDEEKLASAKKELEVYKEDLMNFRIL